MRHRAATLLAAVAIVGSTVGATAGATSSAAGARSSGLASSSGPDHVFELHPKANVKVNAGPTIPMFTTTHTGPGTHVYTFSMVGTNPINGGGAVTVPVKIIPVRVLFTQFGVGLDASKPDAHCLPGASAATYATKSPVFVSRSYAAGPTALGTGQYIEMFRRAEFWAFTRPGGVSPNNRLKLSVQVLPPVTFTGNAANSTVLTAPCGIFGEVANNAFDAFVQSQIVKLKSQGVGPTTLPLFLLYNTAINNGNCCALGYHFKMNNSAFGGAFQTYGVADFDVSGHFGVDDSGTLTHEVGEWADDPTGVNPVPAWGGIGQVSGCQGNLEVGDPLSGTLKTVVTSGVAFHVQELAFVSWFYRDVPSVGVNGWYSNYGKFTHASKPCPPGG